MNFKELLSSFAKLSKKFVVRISEGYFLSPYKMSEIKSEVLEKFGISLEDGSNFFMFDDAESALKLAKFFLKNNYSEYFDVNVFDNNGEQIF